MIKKKIFNRGFVGTIDYLAPELFKTSDEFIEYNEEGICIENDFWTYGLFLYEFLTRRTFPYINQKDRYDTVQQIKLNLFDCYDYTLDFFEKIKFNYTITNEQLQEVSNVFANCVKTCPKKRKLLF